MPAFLANMLQRIFFFTRQCQLVKENSKNIVKKVKKINPSAILPSLLTLGVVTFQTPVPAFNLHVADRKCHTQAKNNVNTENEITKPEAGGHKLGRRWTWSRAGGRPSCHSGLGCSSVSILTSSPNPLSARTDSQNAPNLPWGQEGKETLGVLLAQM